MNRSGFVITYENSMVGLRDATGREVVPCVYDKILDYDDDGYVRVLKGKIYGTIDLEGKEIIPHSLGLTHLGVFHGGSARARKAGLWGLVNEKGEEVTPFVYSNIYAHYKTGYKAVTKDGWVGYLSEDGEFKSSGKKIKPRSRFKEIATYRNDIAPALTDEGWVFIDREQNQVNDRVYWSMDPVLRQGIYNVSKGPQKYGVALYDGTLIIDEWYDYPVHFDQRSGLAVVQRKRLDKDKKEIKLPGGQSAYVYGLLNRKGEYVFPMEYDDIHWNDYNEKTCWYAEDKRACYLLFPDGSRLIYDIHTAVYPGQGLPYIPKKKMADYITQEELDKRYIPRLVATRNLRVCDENKFWAYIAEWTGLYHQPLKFYYRDTEAKIDAKKLYKKYSVVRAGEFMEATDKLRRPIFKTRFFIASCGLIPAPLGRRQDPKEEIPFKEYVIHPDACFVVMDVQQVSGVTQVVLLQIPYYAIQLAKRLKLRLSRLAKITRTPENDSLTSYAKADLQLKLSEPIHGHSLSSYWQQAMNQPIGYDKKMKKISPEKQLEDPKDWGIRLDTYYKNIFRDYDFYWKENTFLVKAQNVIKIVNGEIEKLPVDAIVQVTHTSLAGFPIDGPMSQSGKWKIIDADHQPYKKIIQTDLPLGGGKEQMTQHLMELYKSVLQVAAENDFKTVAFPAMNNYVKSHKTQELAQIALTALVKLMETQVYKGDVMICCDCMKDAEAFQNLIMKKF